MQMMTLVSFLILARFRPIDIWPIGLSFATYYRKSALLWFRLDIIWETRRFDGSFLWFFSIFWFRVKGA